MENSENSELLKIWKIRIKYTQKELNYKVKEMVEEYVDFNPNLAEKYLGKFVTCSSSNSKYNNHINLFDDLDIKIITKNRSVILIHDNKPVGAVIRDAAPKNLSENFGAKIKSIIEGHPILRRGKSHASSGKLVGDGLRANRLDSGVSNYVYKTSNPEEQKILSSSGIILAKWLLDYGKQHLSWSTISYEEFKNNTGLNEDEIIGAVFCAENYEAIGHTDNDRSKYAIGYVYEEGIVKEGFFFYPEYGVAIEMSSNSIWCWLTQAVHGTSKLDLSEDGIRYTAAITLTEKTAKAIERNKK